MYYIRENRRDASWLLFKWLVLIGMLMTLDVWFFWGLNRVVMTILTSIYFVVYYFSNRGLFQLTNEKLIWYMFLLLAYGFYSLTMSRNLFGWIGVVSMLVPPYLLSCLRQIKLMNFLYL